MMPAILAASVSLTYWWEQYGERSVAALAKIAVILIAYYIVRLIANRLIDRLAYLRVLGDGAARVAREARLQALSTVLRSAVGFILGFVALVMVLNAAGINIVPVLTTAGVAGLAIGFGAQKLVRDVISGFFILAEDQYGVGDYVTIGAVTGTVSEVGMRTTRIRNDSGALFMISNGDISQVCNHSRGPYRIVLDVTVPAASDLSHVASVLNDIGAGIAADMSEWVKAPFVCTGLAQISGVTAALRLAGPVDAAHQEAVRLELYRRVRDAFAANNLQLA